MKKSDVTAAPSHTSRNATTHEERALIRLEPGWCRVVRQR